jgi:nucleotide-binding universal stress UspA family protein
MYQDILLTVDLNDEASWSKALPVAVEQVKASGATLHVVSVVPDFGMSVVGGFFPDFCSENVPEGVKVGQAVRYGKIYDEILEFAKIISADLIVIGSHRPELMDYLLGPNAARVVRHAKCSVMVVRD